MRPYMLGLAAISLSAVVLAAAQEPGGGAATTPPPVRDLRGVWLGGGPAPVLEPTAPMTERGAALYAAAKPIWGARAVSVVESNDPLVTCDPLGFPRSILHETRGIEFVQTADKVVQLLQYQRMFREIWTDGRSLPTDVGGTSPQSPDPKRYGYSIGRWADDVTFVVQTTGATETMWGTEYGHPHGLGAHIEERYRRIDSDTLELVVTIADPEMYQESFVALRQLFARGTELDEQLCVPSEAQRYLEIMAKPASEQR